MEARYLEYNDYDTLVEWWKKNRFPPVPRDFLPNNGLDGIMISKDGVDLCAGFIYETSAKNLVWIEFIVANFEVKDRDIRKESQLFLINTLTEMCVNLGKKYIFTSLNNEGLIKRFKECGFFHNRKSTTEMVKNLY